MSDPIADAELTARELGPGRFPQPEVGDLPAGGARWAVESHLGKVGIVNTVARSFRWTYDEALRHSHRNAVAMLRDLLIRDALFARMTPTTQLGWHLEARDESDPAQMRAVKKLEAVLRLTPRWQDFVRSLLWAIWYGRAGVQLLYEWDYTGPDGERRMLIRDHSPLNGDSLVARWASNEWGLLVNSYYDGATYGTDRGMAVFFTPRQREAVVVHRYNPEDADFYEPELSGQLRGSGVRGHVYWDWWLKGQFMTLLSDYGERFANGVWEAYYDQSSPESKDALTQALTEYKSNRVLLLPRRHDGATPYGVTIHEVGSATPQFLFGLVQYLENRIRKYITGVSIDEGTDISVGGDAVGVMEDRIGRVIKMDGEALAETLSVDLMPVLTRYNCGPAMPPPLFKFTCDKPNAGQTLGYAAAIKNLGGDINLTPLYPICGLEPPAAGDNVASRIQPQSVVAATSVPQGVPMAQPVIEPPQQPPQQPAPVEPAQPVDASV